jgi:membrane protein
MRKFREIPIIRSVEKFMRSIYLWDTTVSLYHVISILRQKVITFDIDQRAAAVSFSLLLAIFPAIIFLFTLIPYVPIDNLDMQIMEFLRNILPRGIYRTAAHTIQDIISRRRVEVLSFGFLFSIYAATNGMMALIRAFNISLEKEEKHNFWQGRFIALFLTFLLVLVMISAIVVLIVGKIMIAYLFDRGLLSEDFNFYMIQTLGYSSIFIIFFLGIGSIYYFAVDKTVRMGFFNFGAVLASILCILATNAFSYYLVNFSSYNKLYGSIGTLIGMMVWIYLIAVILIFGFEINSSLRDALAVEHEDEKNPQ